MRDSFTTMCLVLLTVAGVGCIQRAEPSPTSTTVHPQPEPEQSQVVDLAAFRYDTGDVKKWPDYQFPLEHSFDLPEVPPEIVGPFSEDDIPKD